MDTATTVSIYAIGYADDTYGVGGETISLEKPLEATQKWIVDTGQGVNLKKSVAFSTEDPEEREALKIGGDAIPTGGGILVPGSGDTHEPQPGHGTAARRENEESRRAPVAAVWGSRRYVQES